MSDLTRPTTILGWPTTERTVGQIHPANQDIIAISGKLAGEDLSSGQPVYLKTDDAFWRSDANSGTAAEKNVMGLVAKDAYAGDPVTVVVLGEMGGFAAGGTPLVIGAFYFLSDTKGEIATTASTTTWIPVGVATGVDTMFVFPIFGKLHADLLALALA